MKLLKYIILILTPILLFIFWNAGNYSREIVSGGYHGILIGDNKHSVANFLQTKGIEKYRFITLDSEKVFFVDSISEGKRDRWFNVDVWTLTASDDGSYLKAVRFTFANDKLIKIEDWSRWFETP